MTRAAGRLVLVFVLLGAGALLWLALGGPGPRLPTFVEVRVVYRPSDLSVLDRTGAVLHELRIDERRRRLPWTPLGEISPALQAAVIASEDRRFYRHGGVDGRAVVAAGVQRLSGGAPRGASTISMQLATLLDPDLRRRGAPRTLVQKWRQMRVAWALEARWFKAEILEAYLNLVTFRGELEGIRAASTVLFGKAPHGLTEAEAAVLAALLRAPNASPADVARRAWVVLKAKGGAAPREAVETAVRALDAQGGIGWRVALAPHAAFRLLRPLAQAISSSREPLRSTLDGALQQVAAETLRRHLLAVQPQNVRDGAVLVVNNVTGEVLAYVGGSGDLSSARYVDGVQGRRQAGSTLKPFLYGLALERRLLTPASLLEDTPLDLSVAGGLYRPRNYDEQFTGLVTARTALASSLNVPAVRTLEMVGPEAFVQQLQHLGFEAVGESGDFYGPSLALGSADVSLWELVNAYRTLANGGVWNPLRMTLEATGAEVRRRLYSEEVAFLLAHILSDRESRSGTFGLENPLATPFWTAVKTGTSKDMRDNWCIGFSRRYTVGVWVGNFSGAPMRDVSGITGAAPVWLEVMTWLHRDVFSATPEPPAGVIGRKVAFPHDVEPARTEWFLRGMEPPGPAQALARAHSRIVAPVSGTVIALDPDIPRELQRVVFESQGVGRRLRWLLDGADLGPAAALVLWAPNPGRHTLSLVDPERRAWDTVTFEVRGDPAAPASDAGSRMACLAELFPAVPCIRAHTEE